MTKEVMLTDSFFCHCTSTEVAAKLELSEKNFVDRPESYSATHGKIYIYCAEKVAHGFGLKVGPYYWICP